MSASRFNFLLGGLTLAVALILCAAMARADDLRAMGSVLVWEERGGGKADRMCWIVSGAERSCEDRASAETLWIVTADTRGQWCGRASNAAGVGPLPTECASVIDCSQQDFYEQWRSRNCPLGWQLTHDKRGRESCRQVRRWCRQFERACQ